jgi:hypothetical protein
MDKKTLLRLLKDFDEKIKERTITEYEYKSEYDFNVAFGLMIACNVIYHHLMELKE